MASQESDVVDARHPELTICGFVRINYRHSVPIEILKFMELYYSLFIKKRLSKDQLQKLQGLTSGDDDICIPLRSMRLQGVMLTVMLRCHYLGYRDLVLDVGVSPPIELIGGYFAFNFAGKDLYRRNEWERPEYSCIDGRIFDPLSFRNRSELIISGYLDINQIKWREEDKQDFDITPTLNSCGEHRWLIDDDAMAQLAMRRTSCRSKSGWKFSIYSSYDRRNLRMRCSPPFLLIKVSHLEAEVTVRYELNGERCFFRGTDGDFFSELGFKTGIALNEFQSNTELTVNWKIVRVEGMDGKDIQISDWPSNGICVANVD